MNFPAGIVGFGGEAHPNSPPGGFAEANLAAAGRREIAEDAGVKVAQARAAKDVTAGVAVADGGDRHKRVWVEVGISSADTAQNRDIRFHLVGSLRAAGSIQTGTCRPYSKGEAGQPA